MYCLSGDISDDIWQFFSGARFFLHLSVPLNKSIGFVKIMRNLSENKRAKEALHESEERLRITMNSATDYAIISLDTAGLINSWSKGAQYIFGYSEEEVMGKDGAIIFVPEDVEAGVHKKEMLQAISEGRANDERWHLRKDRSRLFMSGVMTPIMNNSRIAGFVKVARDMTDRRLAEQRKDEFIGIASHELKTPVTSIKAYTELMLETFQQSANAKSVELITKLDEQVNRLIDLIHSLLDTTRIAEGSFELELETFDLNELIKERVFDLQATTKKHSLVLKAESTRHVRADRERIGQVVTNIISNAIKYSPAGGDVTITTQDLKNGARVCVKDAGIGIPAEAKERIFERFFRVGHPRINTYPGMGLGLYIAAGIVQQHGGTMDAESVEGKGSLFRFSLPFRPL